MIKYRTLKPHIRWQVLERDKHTCQMCKRTDKPLETHHIMPVKKGGSDELSNIMTLCHKCHKTVEPARSIYGDQTIRKYRIMQISNRTKEELKSVGQYGDSFNSILQRLINYWKDGHINEIT